MTLLSVRNLTVEYHTDAGIFRAVEDLNFELEECSTLGLVGESGCGKTTAMLALMRLLPEVGRIISGSVLLQGQDLLQLPLKDLRKIRWEDLAMVFQGAMNALNPVRTVGSQIGEALLYHGTIPRDGVKPEVSRLLDIVGVSTSYQNRYPHQLSGGMRQRAMIAMALACRPKVLITDEPTTALDVMVQAQIMDLLEDIKKEFNLGIILVTHDLGVVAENCDQVLVMYAGRMAEYGPADRIYNHPVHPYTERLMLAFPDIDRPDAKLVSIPGYPPPLNNLPEGCRFEPRCGLRKESCKTETPEIYEVVPGHFASCLSAGLARRSADE
jgi:peptide/nickel transport system ATP-binding protein